MDLASLYSGWSPAAGSAWAKLSDPRLSVLSGMSLTAHLTDSAQVAEWLWANFVPQSVHSRLADQLGGSEAAAAAVVFCAGVHDIGKLTPVFARKAERVGRADTVDAMRRAGLLLPPARDDIPHGITGQVITEEWLRSRFGLRRGTAAGLAAPIGGHHGVYPSHAQLARAQDSWWAFSHLEIAPDEWGTCPWSSARTEILDRFAEVTGFDRHIAAWKRNGWPVGAQMLITGVVILADWIASNEDFFPYTEPKASRLADALNELALPPAWAPNSTMGTDDLFRARFPHLAGLTPSPLQQATMALAEQSQSPSLIIVEAPMGAGKTEAAYLAAEVWARRLGCGGVFFGLPTMATANPMFDRTLEWLGNMLSSDASVMLAHSKAGLQDNFQSLVRDGRFRGVSVDDERGGAEVQTGAMVASWLSGRKKASQASFVVGTVDQLLMMALRAKHVCLRQLGMAGKVVVIDECHANDDYMRVYLSRALTWLAENGAPVLLLSATLPPSQRQQYADAYASGLGQDPTPVTSGDGYPRLTCVGERTQATTVDPDKRSSSVTMSPMPDDPDTLVAILSERLGRGGCAAVIRNTVGRAQETFDLLHGHFGDDVMLLHSRFIAPHRTKLERRLVEQLGRSGDRPERLIVVGTQVLEQSLDIDLDFMVSDLAPMDLLLQRAGRLHRHDGRHRPEPLAVPVLMVTGADFEAAPPEPVSGSRIVYGLAKLLRAAALIPRNGLMAEFPSDIPRLVAAAYDPDRPPPPGWEEAWERAEGQQRVHVEQQVEKAQNFLLIHPHDQETLLGSDTFEAADPESTGSRGKRQVRDSAESLEVIVLVRDADGALTLPEVVSSGRDVIPENPLEPIPTHLARLMATSTISLPLAMTRQFDAVEAALNTSLDYGNWDTSPWLKGELALVLDANLTATVADFHLTYDNQKGLMYVQERPRP